MNKLDWAKNEVRLAQLAEPDVEPEDHLDEYVNMCYDSALKTLETLLDARHSGMSIGITMNILNALVEGRPLTPIEDKSDEWERCISFNDGATRYQHKRMSSMFKETYANGRVRYSDQNRYSAYDIAQPESAYSSGLVTRVLDELFPIKFPYTPPAKKYKVYCESFLYRLGAGDFDTTVILYITLPDGTNQDVFRCFREAMDVERAASYYGNWVEIPANEYIRRELVAKNR